MESWEMAVGDGAIIARQAMLRARNPVLTLLVPVFNEEDAVAGFLDAVVPVLEKTRTVWRILFVNDGSRDGTLDRLLTASGKDRRIAVINLARNFGKEAALTAGLDHVDADAVIVMDVDLQDPPELILDFLVGWREGYDVVYGVRSDRQTDTWLKRRTAGAFYTVFNAMAPVPIPKNVGDYRLIDRRVVEAVRQMRERNRFMKGLFAWVGFPAKGVAFERRLRATGQSKFRMRSLWNFAIDGIVGFSTLPLKTWTYLGLMVAVGAIIFALTIIIRTVFFGIDVPGYASLMVVILILGALQLISFGIFGEYIARLTIEAKQRPNYIIEGHYGGPETD